MEREGKGKEEHEKRKKMKEWQEEAGNLKLVLRKERMAGGAKDIISADFKLHHQKAARV